MFCVLVFVQHSYRKTFAAQLRSKDWLYLGDPKTGDTTGAAREAEHDTADIRGEAEGAGKVEVAPGEAGLAGGDVYEVRDGGEGAAPGGDAGLRGGDRHLGHGPVGDL